MREELEIPKTAIVQKLGLPNPPQLDSWAVGVNKNDGANPEAHS